MGERYRRMEDQKPWCGLAHTQDLVKRRRLKPIVQMLNLEDFVE